MSTNKTSTIYFLSFLVIALLIWNVLIMTGKIKTNYNKENMKAGPQAGGAMAFDDVTHKPQSEEEKRDLMGFEDAEYLKKYGSAFGGSPKEAMKAYWKGQGIQMSAPVATEQPMKENYGGASTMGLRKYREKIGANIDFSRLDKGSLPPLKPIGVEPYKENMVIDKEKGGDKFIYTEKQGAREKIQAFTNGEKYKVKTAMTCAGPTINHLTDMVIDTCQAHCAHDNQCAAFAYNFRNGDCRTYADCSRVVHDDEEVQVFSRQAR